ncbi:MAG: hypothetical protein E6Q97_29840 [Desulfurellales bacterium]|nr:MAG: hypothetical protein E6Q97_29840 [Desulfurellales bacterium]
MAMSKDVATAITTAAFATGHGDSVLDMVNELVGQASDFRAEVARLNALLEADGDALKGRAVTIAGLRAQLAETQKHAEKSREMSLIDLARKQEAEDKYTQLLIEHAETQKLLEVQLAVGDKLTAEVAKHEAFEASMRCPQCDLLRLEIGELIGDAEIGRRWRSNSSLEEWFPLSAEELKSAKADVTRLNKLSRMALSQKVSIVDTGVIPYRVCLNGQVLGDSLREVIDKAIIYPPEE